MRKRHVKSIEAYDERTKELPELQEEECVAVQNQDGNHPNRWDRTGKIVEKLPYRQYKVKMDGSNRVTLRNRRFLRKINPVCIDGNIPDVAIPPPRPSSIPQVNQTAPVTNPVERIPPQEPDRPTDGHERPSATIEPAPPVRPAIRQSTREKIPRRMFEAQPRGKFHTEKPVDS